MESILNTTGHALRYPDIVKAENCHLYDSRGNRYLDLESGVWCTSIGHCHPRVTQAIREQAGRMIHTGYCYLNPLIDATARRVLTITGIGTGSCVFLCSGSGAVEYSVQLAASISDKPCFLTMRNCYLSAYGISGQRSENRWIHFDWMGHDDVDAVDFSKVAAFVFEPGSSLGLVRFPPGDLIEKIVERTRESGGIVVANEVTTGTGRTGKWFGHQHYGIVPDIVAIGKGIGNGYPVSCVAMSRTVAQRAARAGFHYAQSHQNDPLGAAVAEAVIDVIENEALLRRAVELGEVIRQRLRGMQERFGLIGDVRGRGLMTAVEFEAPGPQSVAEAVNERLHEKHIILVKRPGHEVFRIDPALTIESGDVEYFLDSLEEILADTAAAAH